MHPDERQALELFMQIERLGWELVTSLHPLRLTVRQGEELLMRLDWLHQYRQEQQEMMSSPARE